MEFLIAIIALVLLMVVILVISAPLRAGGSSTTGRAGSRTRRVDRWERVAASTRPSMERPLSVGVDRDAIAPAERHAELEAAREAKYREIRDTELDYRTGKLSQEDFAATDNALRAEAVEILDRLAALEGDGATES